MSARSAADDLLNEDELCAMLRIPRKELARRISRDSAPAPDVVLTRSARRWRRTSVDAWISARRPARAE